MSKVVYLIVPLLFSLSLYGQSDSLLLSINLDDVVVTAQYAPTSAEAATHQVRIVKAEEWQNRGLNSLTELLQQELNIRIQQDPILGAGISMQGMSGKHVQIMIDGVPVIGRVGGNVDLGQLNMNQFERVEIVMGSMSAQYGSNAAGGVINLISKKHQINQWKLEAGTQFESLDINNQFLSVGRKIGDFKIDGGINRYSANFASKDSLRIFEEVEGSNLTQRKIPWNPKQQIGYDANISYRPDDSLDIRYGYRAFSETVSLLGKTELKEFPSFSYAIDQFFTTHRKEHHLTVNHWLNKRLYWKTTAGLNTFQRDKDTRRLHIAVDTTSTEPAGQDTTTYTGAIVRSSLNLIGTGKWSGQIGLEYFSESGKGKRIQDNEANQLQPFITNIAGWSSIRYAPSAALTLEGNLRAAYNNRYKHPLIPSFQALWRSGNHWQWRFGYACGFRSPSVQELFFYFVDINHHIEGNNELDAETSHNVRMSGNWKIGDRNKTLKMEVGVTLFYNKISNRIALEYAPTAIAPNRYIYQNLENYETNGANLELAVSPAKWLDVETKANYTRLLNTLDVPASEKRRFIGLFEMSNSLGFSWEAMKLTGSINHRYIGKRDFYQRIENNDGSYTIKRSFVVDYHLVDFAINRSFWANRIKLGAGIKNLFDKERIPIVGGSASGGAHSGGNTTRLTGFGRNYFASLRFMLG